MPKQLMNIILLPLVFLLLHLNAMAQPGDFQHRSRATDTVFAADKIVVRGASGDTIEIAGFKNGLKNGKQTLYFNNGEISRISNYRNGLLHGTVEHYSRGNKKPVLIENYKAFPAEQTARLDGTLKRFATDGRLTELYQYKNGLRNGKYQLYHSNGRVKEKGTFSDDLQIGNKRIYATDATLLREETYIIVDNPNFSEGNPNTAKTNASPSKKLSVLHGKANYYHPNGRLSSELLFRHGKKEGLCKEYHQDHNTLKSAVEFKDGLEHGAFSYFKPNGNLERKGIYYREIRVNDTLLKNVYDGTIEIYQENGKKQRIENWKHFKRNGLHENYYHQSGELSERLFYIDNLKSGTEQRFDKQGNKTYEAFYEIVEVNGHKTSQQTGTETQWENGKIKSTTEWVNGVREGLSKSYFPSGQLEVLMHFRNGKLHGTYNTFYENGQPKEQYNKQLWTGTGNSEYIGWNSVYDESGNIKRKFFATGDTKNIIEENFDNGKRLNLIIDNVFRLEFTENSMLHSVHWLNYSRPVFGFDLFRNQQLRRVHFQASGHPPLTANFTAHGQVNQVAGATGAYVDDKKINETARKVSAQFNPAWADESLATKPFPDADYKWHYQDGSPFFEIGFKQGLPEGKWMAYNPIIKDTLFYGTFEKGKPVGKLIRKRIDGNPDVRYEYHPNHKVKAYYRYDDSGHISEVTKNDSLGNRVFAEEYFPGGKLKSRSIPPRNSYLYFSATGDTLSYNLLFTKLDSIRIERQFYGGNRIKTDRYNNLSTGTGSVKSYFENGQLQSAHELKYTKTHGTYRKYDESGKLLTLGHFKDGKRDGRWINYHVNGKEEVSFFREDEIVLDEPTEPENKNYCRCHDTSLPAGKIGFANSLAYLSDLPTIKPYIPRSIVPVNDWQYDKIFYINLNTNNGRDNGSTSLKLLLFNDFSFHYPVADYLRINLNPCRTEGYIGNMQANVSYDFNTRSVNYAQLHPKRISVSLDRNPLVDANDRSAFTAYFDTDYIHFDAAGIQSVHFAKVINECFPVGLINDFMEIKIQSAQLRLKPQEMWQAPAAPLLANEMKQFYGFEIHAAVVHFAVDGIPVTASCERILAGANYVAGRIVIEGNPKEGNEFQLAEGKQTIDITKLTKLLEQKGFYRVKATVADNRLNIEFYVEK